MRLLLLPLSVTAVLLLSSVAQSSADAAANAAADPAASASAAADATPNAAADSKSALPSSSYGYHPGGHTAALPPYAHKPQHHHHKPPRHGYVHEYKEPEPVVLIQETFPKQNCSVQDEALRAEICVPDFQTKCEEEGLMSKRLEQGEFCYDVTSTVCRVENTTAEIKVCKFEMEREEASSTAKTVEVEFKQECETNMVTVCEPVTYQPPPPPPTYAPPYAAPSYKPHYKPPPPPPQVYQQCKEVAQETCYNIPQIIEKEIEVTMGFPKPSKDCEMQTVTIPEVKCEDVVESRCQNIPRLVDDPENVESCQVVVGPPKCSEVELVLPKQICQDIVYGFAEEVKEPKIVYEPPPAHPEPSYGAPQHHQAYVEPHQGYHQPTKYPPHIKKK